MSGSSNLQSILAAVRVANLPGVACHVITGALVASWATSSGGQFARLESISISLAAFAGVLLCVAGNLLNDWKDRDWDAKHRPERALPSGRFRPVTFLSAGLGSLLIGMAVLFVLDWRSGLVSLGITCCIGIYTRFHKRTAWSILPLAACRGLLPVLGAFAMGGDAASLLVLGLGASLFLWTCGLSLDARGESNGARVRHSFAWALLLAAPLASAWAVHSIDPLPWQALAPAMLWLLMVRGPYRHSAKMRVSALLAGLPLLDFIVLSCAWGTQPGLSPMFLWIPFLAFGTGRLLQRAASAT